MEAVLEIIGSMNLPIHKPTKQSMKEYVEGIIREARNFSVLRVSEFLNFSYQRLQYLVSEARFRDTELEQTRLQWAVSQSSQQQKGPEFDLVIDDTQNRRFVRTYFASKCYIGNIGKVDIAQSTVFSSLINDQEIIPFGFKPYISAENFVRKQKDQSFATKIELGMYLVQDAVIFERILRVKIRYVIADSVYASAGFMNRLHEGEMKYFFGLKPNRRAKLSVLGEGKKKGCPLSSLVTAEEGWQTISFSERRFRIKSLICSLRDVRHELKVFIFYDVAKGKVHIYGTNDLDMNGLGAIGCYMERARMDNKLFRTAKSYLALSRGKFHKLSSYIRHFHIVMLIFTILLFISTKSRISMYQLIKTMVKYKN
jgi:hypothetical protein